MKKVAFLLIGITAAVACGGSMVASHGPHLSPDVLPFYLFSAGNIIKPAETADPEPEKKYCNSNTETKESPCKVLLGSFSILNIR
ncbi:hypothetical protein SAMN05444266_11053 [Chitinophaga jiangningensis]|uniref:Lipoprotein n=1 Tax=Chitinophaga jiangningensis TaxID=1419482 RepID=A0A1M7KXN2_9BACT|nr:hypothetical protein [Chitinophaga jiangningensis]SHM70372.1 hypothetical protein SAMN05444266_11053 [Chitinophaga jiangningensis]